MLPPAQRSRLCPYTTLFRSIHEVFDGDPWPYGVEKNRPTLEALVTYLADQHLIAEKVAVDDLFVPNYGEIERSEEHTSELQSPVHLVCRLLLEKKNTLQCAVRRLTCCVCLDAPARAALQTLSLHDALPIYP